MMRREYGDAMNPYEEETDYWEQERQLALKCDCVNCREWAEICSAKADDYRERAVTRDT